MGRMFDTRRPQHMITIWSPSIVGKTVREIELEYHIQVEQVDGVAATPERSLKRGSAVLVKGADKWRKSFEESAMKTVLENSALATKIAGRLVERFGIDQAQAERFADDYVDDVESHRAPERADKLIRRLRDERRAG